MTNEQIIALAREYAEEMCAHMEDDFIKDEAIRDNESAFMMVVERLSRRFCLVEKSKVEEEYTKTCDSVNKHSATTGCLFFVGQKQTIEFLFPEIAKEVEE